MLRGKLEMTSVSLPTSERVVRRRRRHDAKCILCSDDASKFIGPQDALASSTLIQYSTIEHVQLSHSFDRVPSSNI